MLISSAIQSVNPIDFCNTGLRLNAGKDLSEYELINYIKNS